MIKRAIALLILCASVAHGGALPGLIAWYGSQAGYDFNSGLLCYYGMDSNWVDYVTDRIVTPASANVTFSSDHQVGTHSGDFAGGSANDNVPLYNGTTLLHGKTECTLSTWVNLHEHKQYAGFLVRTISFANIQYIGLGAATAGKFEGIIETTNRSQVVISSNAFDTSEWHNVTMTWKTNEPLRIYLDGALDGTSTNSLDAPLSSFSSTFMMGCLAGNADYAMDGLQDSAAIWDRQMPQAEIAEWVKITGVSKTSIFDHTYTQDSTANANHGKIINPATVQFTNDCPFVGEKSFVSGATYVRIPDSAALNPANSITVSAWVKPVSSAGTYGILAKGTVNNTRASDYEFVFFSSKVYFGMNGAYDTAFAVAPSAGAWAHVAATYNGTNVVVYVNGIAGTPVAYTNAINDSTNGLFLSAAYNTTVYFQDKMSDVQVWSRGLSSNEIYTAWTTTNRLVGNESGLVGYWKLDEPTIVDPVFTK